MNLLDNVNYPENLMDKKEIDTIESSLIEINDTDQTEERKAVPAKSSILNESISNNNSTINNNAEIDYSSYTLEELVDALKQRLNQNIEEIKEEVEHIKQHFYKKLKSETEEQKNSENKEVEEENLINEKNKIEENFKSLLAEFREKKAHYQANIEKNLNENLAKKQEILEKMKALSESKDDVSTHINEFKALQQEWRTIGLVPPANLNTLQKKYNAIQEAFWDLIKINNELKEYDFRKNLEAKVQICEAAEKLEKEETDVIIAFQKLQKLHEEWHEIGPVSRELREQIWQRFKNASTIINKKHQSYFESIKKKEEENLITKTVICEKIEMIDFTNLKSFNDWNEATKNILTLQKEWRTIGFAPKKMNQKIFERYRKACDTFFTAKAEFYKQIRNTYAENYKKKLVLCEQAEDLKDSTDWQDTAEKMIQLQKEWKNIGPVSKKYSDDLWKRFISACDYFFEQKKKVNNNQKNSEIENLEKKRDLIARINAFQKTENISVSLLTLRALIDEWYTIGHVPFKEKDKIYKEFRLAIEKKYDELNIDFVSRKLEIFKNNLQNMRSKGPNKLYQEREKLMKSNEHLKSEITTYENNLGFFSSSSQKGDKVISELEKKIEALKEEKHLIEEKIKLIEEYL